MGKLGLNISIDVTKIDKNKLIKGAKGTYLNLTAFINDEKNQYNQNGSITQSKDKTDDTDMPFLGNIICFWNQDFDAKKSILSATQKEESCAKVDIKVEEDDDLPF